MTVRHEVHGRVLVVRIEREHKRNAIDEQTTAGIDAALNLLDDDPALWVGVLTGTTTVFCAGTDIKDGPGPATERGGPYGVIRRRRIKPLIAAVEGVAFGGGFEIAMACDVVVASTAARFALPETRRGLVANSGALFRAMRALPLHIAKELLVTGAELSAERAYHFGVVNRLSAPGEALATALGVADEICQSSPVSVRATLAAIAEQVEAADAAGWRATEAAETSVRDGADRQEGLDAFFERRAPEWPGR
jgi:enoyl-CoA hydratase/carnithine racemase